MSYLARLSQKLSSPRQLLKKLSGSERRKKRRRKAMRKLLDQELRDAVAHLGKSYDVSCQLLEARIDKIYQSLLRREYLDNYSKAEFGLEDLMVLDFGGITLAEIRQHMQYEHGLVERSILKSDRIALSPLQLATPASDIRLPTYLATHIARFEKNFELLNSVAVDLLQNGEFGMLLDVGTHACYHPQLKAVAGDNAEFIGSYNDAYECYHESKFHELNLEKDRLPFADGNFKVVTMFEVLEHFYQDPMKCIAEINRVLSPNGYFILSTPNVDSWRSLYAILTGYHPYRYGVYTPNDYPHVHEYTPAEVKCLLEAGGFEARVFTCDVYGEERYTYLSQLIGKLGFEAQNRGDTIYAVARKVSGVADMRPSSLYAY